MANVNAVGLVGTTHVYTVTNWGLVGADGGETGTRGYEHDGNFSTHWGSWASNGRYYIHSIASYTNTFEDTFDIVNIKVKAYSQSNGQAYWGGWYRTPNYVRIYLKQSGAWTLLFNDTRSQVDWLVNYDSSIGWSCDGIGVEVKSSGEGTYCSSLIYEVQAFYTPFNAGGIRIKTSGDVVAIGMEALDDHNLRVCAPDGNTYGIPLLATNDPDASNIRIYDGSAVKALPKVVI